MNEYQFQYSKNIDILLVLLSCLLSYSIAMYIMMEIFHLFDGEMPLLFIYILLIVPFLGFRLFKNKLGRHSIAKMSSDSVEFNFKNETVRTINFSDLTSYEFINGKNGPVLYLRSNNDRLKIFALDYCCNSEPLDSLCKDIVAQIEKYKIENISEIINGGNLFQRKGTLRFIIILTILILLLSFITTLDLIESAELKVIIRIFGGILLFVFWLTYFVEKERKKKNNES